MPSSFYFLLKGDTMQNNWKRKLSSRKFWALVAGFVSGLIIFFGYSTGTADRISALIMSGGSIFVYMLAEGLADSKPNPEPISTDAVSQTTIGFDTSDTEEAPDDKIKVKVKCPY